jgi:CelD/BcsL family acetyltransferase involved in cellulose biosynthesis
VRPWPCRAPPSSRRPRRGRPVRGARDHDVVLRQTEDPETLDADLDTLFGLHATRWQDASSFAPNAAFHRAFARDALANGWLRLAILDVDGHPAAARYDFRMGSVHLAYYSGRDTAWASESVGLVLRVLTMRRALEEGVREYRFLRGGEAYKYRFATSDAGLVTVAQTRGVRGRAAALAITKAAGRPMVRRFIERFV